MRRRGTGLKRYVETFPQDSFMRQNAQPRQLQGTAEMSGVRWPAAGSRLSLISICIFSAALLASSKPAEQSRIAFENRQEKSGVTFVLNNGTTDDKPIIDSTLGGVALLDYDNDGYLDIFFTNGASIPGLDKSNRRFLLTGYTTTIMMEPLRM